MKIKLPKIENILQFIFAVLLLLSCYSVYYMVYSKIIDYSCLAITGILAVYKISKRGALNRIRRKSFSVSVLLYISMVLIVTATMTNTGASFIIRYLYFYPLSIVIIAAGSYDDNIKLVTTISNIIYFLVISSIILWIIGPVLNFISPIGNYDIYWGYQTKYNNYFFALFTANIQGKYIFGQSILRNICIYPEGPFASLIFTLGLSTDIFLKKGDVKLTRIVLYSIAIISTISTTGMLILFVIFAIRYMQRQIGKGSVYNGSFVIRTFVIPIALIIIGYIASAYILEYKQVNDLGNYIAHLQDLRHGLESFLKKPIAGYGYGYTAFSKIGNNTSGLFKILIYGGTIFGIFFVYPYVRAVVYGFCNKNSDIAIFAIIVFILLLLVIWQNSFLILFYMSLFFVVSQDRTEKRV